MFEDEFSELQADMVDICNEYSCEAAEKIFIYVSYEGLLNTDYFYSINGDIIERHKLNTSGINADFDVSVDCQKQVLNILKEDVHKIKAVCDKYNQPMPTEMRLVYEPKTKKFTAEYKYENQTSDKISVFDNYDAWFEEERAKLANLGEEPTGKYKA